MATDWAVFDPLRSELEQYLDCIQEEGWDDWASALYGDEEHAENERNPPCASCHEECGPACPYYSVALEKHGATLKPAEEDESAYL
jgi:hypothetical protein